MGSQRLQVFFTYFVVNTWASQISIVSNLVSCVSLFFNIWPQNCIFLNCSGGRLFHQSLVYVINQQFSRQTITFCPQLKKQYSSTFRVCNLVLKSTNLLYKQGFDDSQLSATLGYGQRDYSCFWRQFYITQLSNSNSA